MVTEILTMGEEAAKVEEGTGEMTETATIIHEGTTLGEEVRQGTIDLLHGQMVIQRRMNRKRRKASKCRLLAGSSSAFIR